MRTGFECYDDVFCPLNVWRTVTLICNAFKGHFPQVLQDLWLFHCQFHLSSFFVQWKCCSLLDYRKSLKRNRLPNTTLGFHWLANEVPSLLGCCVRLFTMLKQLLHQCSNQATLFLWKSQPMNGFLIVFIYCSISCW